MKIFIVPSWYPSQLSPKSGTFFREWAQILQKNGDDVTVIVDLVHSFRDLFRFRHLKVVRYEPKHIDGITEYRQETLNWFPKRPHQTFQHQRLRILDLISTAVSQSGKPDLVIAQSSLFAGAELGQWTKDRNIPLIVCEHLMHFLKPDMLTGFHKDCIREAYRYTDRIVATSSPLRNAIVTQFPEATSKIATIPNPVDISAFNIAPMRKTAETFEFLSVALFRPEKRHDLLLRALAQVRQRHPEARLTLVGDGPENCHIKRLIAELKLTDVVTLTGYLPKPEIAARMQQSHALVLASDCETFGVVLIEALAGGLPVIATRCGGPEDIVSPENGFLVPVNSVEALADAMQCMITEYPRFDPQNIRQTAVEKYSGQRYRQAIHDLYNKIMNGKST